MLLQLQYSKGQLQGEVAKPDPSHWLPTPWPVPGFLIALWNLTCHRPSDPWELLNSSLWHHVPLGHTSERDDGCKDGRRLTSPWRVLMIYYNFIKSKGNLRFRRLLPLFVPISICVTTHDDGTASDVTIGMWCHSNRPRTTSATANLGFSLPK